MARETETPENKARAQRLYDLALAAAREAGLELVTWRRMLNIQMRERYWQGRVWPEEPIALREVLDYFREGQKKKVLVRGLLAGHVPPMDTKRPDPWLAVATVAMLTGGANIVQLDSLIKQFDQEMGDSARI